DDGGATVTKVLDGRASAIALDGSRLVVGGDTVRISTDGGRTFTTRDTRGGAPRGSGRASGGGGGGAPRPRPGPHRPPPGGGGRVRGPGQRGRDDAGGEPGREVALRRHGRRGRAPARPAPLTRSRSTAGSRPRQSAGTRRRHPPGGVVQPAPQVRETCSGRL